MKVPKRVLKVDAQICAGTGIFEKIACSFFFNRLPCMHRWVFRCVRRRRKNVIGMPRLLVFVERAGG